MNSKPTLAALVLPLCLALSGCKPDPALKRAETIGGTKATSTPPNGAGVETALNGSGPSADITQFGSVSGVMTFAGKPPARVPIDMSMDPACAMSGGTNLSEQYVITSGKIANVYVYIKAGAVPSRAPAGSPATIMDQHGCKYIPHVIALQQGGSVEFRNSDPTMHNIHSMPAMAGNHAVDISQGPNGLPQAQEFDAPEVMMPVRCNNHPWMNAFINVADSPYFAVSNGEGKFEIRGLPPGTYTLAAVHEKLGEQDQQIVVPAKGAARVTFVFGPK